jgi:uncharacterized damage-inducible protein DinB
MAYIVCVEEIEKNWIAHVPDLPGCFSSHEDREKAIQTVPRKVEEYVAWCKGHGFRISGLSAPMVVTELIRTWEFEDGHMVHAFFASDRPPVVEQELSEYEGLLQATMKDLLSTVDDLSLEDEMRGLSGERWSIEGVLDHVTRTELFYLDRIGLAFSAAELKPETRQALKQVQDHTIQQLPGLARRSGVVTLAGETWSSRKIMRRCLWHRRDHTQHIQKLRTRLGR